MPVGFILAATLQVSFSLPTQLQGANCQPDGGTATTLMTAHARLLDAGWWFVREDSVTLLPPGDRVSFGWDVPPGFYWAEVWASNRMGAGCRIRDVYQVGPSVPPADTTKVKGDPFENYEVFDVTGRRIATGRGDWKPQGMRRGIYWVRRGAGRQAVVKKVVLR